MLRAEMAALPPAVASWHPGGREWCIKEVLGHLVEAERRGFAGRIQMILEHADPLLREWDQVAVARARRDCDRPAARVLREFLRVRATSAHLMARLRAADLRRGGQHPAVGHLTVGALLHEWVHHDRNHVRQLLANVQAFAWPHMGNARRFSDRRIPAAGAPPPVGPVPRAGAGHRPAART